MPIPFVWKDPKTTEKLRTLSESRSGSNDNLTSPETVRTFAKQHNADLTMMENGEHWFHTDEQMRFLDDWIRRKEKEWT